MASEKDFNALLNAAENVVDIALDMGTWYDVSFSTFEQFRELVERLSEERRNRLTSRKVTV